ncbi:MAG TPA: hypothetical protein PK728_03905 [Bacillota bacterium]|nr:hypothetical protein [Bacillota bacterium]
MPAINSRLMGYNKKQVDRHMEAVLKLQENEISLITENIKAYRKEKEQLAGELSALQNEMASRVKPRDFLEYSLEKAKSYSALVEAAVKEDIQGISKSLKQRVAMYEKYSGEIENEIAVLTSQMDSMLQRILSLTEEKGTVKGGEGAAAKKVVGTILPSASKFDSIITALGSTHISANEDITGRPVVSSNGTFVGLVGSLVVNRSTSDIEGFYLKEAHSGTGRFVHADCVMAVKKDSLVISADWQKMSIQAGETGLIGKTAEENSNIVEAKMTADGVAAPGTADSGGTSESVKDEVRGLPATVSREIGQESSGSYWESLDLDLRGECLRDSIFLHELIDEDGYGSFREGVEAGYEETATEFFSGSETAFAIEAPAVPESGEAPLIQESAVSAGAGQKPVRPPEEKGKKVQASPAVEKEIKTIRHKYVVGKLAGEDLLDGSGKVIILKNELITPEVVERAEAEGKLPELIINMVIPGLES